MVGPVELEPGTNRLWECWITRWAPPKRKNRKVFSGRWFSIWRDPNLCRTAALYEFASSLGTSRVISDFSTENQTRPENWSRTEVTSMPLNRTPRWRSPSKPQQEGNFVRAPRSFPVTFTPNWKKIGQTIFRGCVASRWADFGRARLCFQKPARNY